MAKTTIKKGISLVGIKLPNLSASDPGKGAVITFWVLTRSDLLNFAMIAR